MCEHRFGKMLIPTYAFFKSTLEIDGEKYATTTHLPPTLYNTFGSSYTAIKKLFDMEILSFKLWLHW